MGCFQIDIDILVTNGVKGRESNHRCKTDESHTHLYSIKTFCRLGNHSIHRAASVSLYSCSMLDVPYLSLDAYTVWRTSLKNPTSKSNFYKSLYKSKRIENVREYRIGDSYTIHFLLPFCHPHSPGHSRSPSFPCLSFYLCLCLCLSLYVSLCLCVCLCLCFSLYHSLSIILSLTLSLILTSLVAMARGTIILIRGNKQ